MANGMRADGRRNREQLLAAARAAFSEHGTEVSLRDVARRADVGIGTLYRHFPTREALIEATMRQNLDSLCAQADELLDTRPAGEALSAWLVVFATGSTRYHGLPASILAALHDEDSPLHHSCRSMNAAAGRLLDSAQRSGDVRPGITVDDLLALATGIAWAGQQASDDGELAARLLRLTGTGFLHHA